MRIACGFLLLGVLLAPLVAQPVAQVPPTKATPADIARWVKQLAADDFGDREEATRKLWEAGSAAEDAINKAAKSTDAEVSRRAGDIAEKFRWGIYPETPKAVVDAIGRFQTGDGNAKAEVVKELLDQGTLGCKALIRISRQELGAEVRPQVLAALSNELNRSIPDLLATKNEDLLRDLLDVALDDPNNPTAQQNYLAYWLLTNKVEERIAHHKKLLDAGNGERRRAETLALLYRAKGAYQEAVAVADKAGNETLGTLLLQEAGDWKALVERGNKGRQGEEVEFLGYRMAYARLAGDERTFAALLADVKKRGEDLQPEDAERFNIAKALFLNDQPDAGLALLEKGEHFLDRIQILVGRMKYKEAFALVQKARDDKRADLPQIELLEARTLAALGEKDRARKIFDRYAEQIKADNDVSWLENLVESEAKSGLRDLALEHSGKILTFSQDQGWPRRLLGKIFPGRTEQAEALWSYLVKRFPAQDKTVLLRQLRDLLASKIQSEALLALTKNAADTVGELPPPERLRSLLAVAQTLNQCNEEKAALELLDSIKSDRAKLQIGDIHAAKGRHADAATAYRAAFDLKRYEPLPLYLLGVSLEKAGKVAEGKALREQAHWICLGRSETINEENEELRRTGRNDFIKELSKRGHGRAVAREVDLMRRIAEPGEYYCGEAIRREGIAALDRKDYPAAANAHEQAMLRCLQGHINFVEKAAYVGVPAMVHAQRAAGLVQAGKMEDARKEFALATGLSPGVLEGSIRMVQVLEKAGKKQEADALFERAQSEHRALLKEHPNCAWALNSMAWLSATTRRNLDQARKDAERATTLDADAPGYLDTLAEILFQLGDKDAAIATQKKAIAMAPGRIYFKKQLARLEAGDKTADLPPEEDDDDDD